MTRTWSALLFFVVFFPMSLWAQDISGAWDGELYWPNSCKWVGFFEFHQSGNPGTLAGSGSFSEATGYTCPGDRIGVVSGGVDGASVEFNFPAGAPGEGLLTGTIVGNSISGTWESVTAYFSGTWTATRRTKPSEAVILWLLQQKSLDAE